MAAPMKYPSRDDPVECARKVCEWHAANTGDPLTHQEVMVVHLNMGEPEARQKCLQLVKEMTSEGGEFHYLLVEKKFAVAHKLTAEKLGLQHRRLRGFQVINRMVLADKAREVVAAHKYTSTALKARVTVTLDLAEQFAGRHFGVARYWEMNERIKEIDATANSDARVDFEKIRLLQEQNAFLKEALLAFASSARPLPPSDAAE